MWNIHICKIYIYRNPAKHWRLSCFRHETFITFLILGFWHEERETQFLLCWLFHLTRQRAAHPTRPNLSRLGSNLNLLRPASNPNSLLFSKYPRMPAHRFQVWPHSHPHPHFLSRDFIMTSVIVTSSPREGEHLHSMCAPTHELSRKVLSLTKLKDKI